MRGHRGQQQFDANRLFVKYVSVSRTGHQFSKHFKAFLRFS